jgi:hypothetical protein
MDNIIREKIEGLQKEIRTYQDKINKIYEKRMNKYFKLREIMENVENHEDDLICKPLKADKKDLYQKTLDEYKESYEQYKKEEESNINKIEGCFQSMSVEKTNLLNIEKIKESTEIQAFENKRRDNLNKIIGYMKDEKLNMAAMDKIVEMIQQDDTTKK